jgi:DNA-binding MarR family transcriptional regulator
MSSVSPKNDRGPLLGSLLRIANQALSERVVRWLADSGHGDVQLAHLAVTQPLWDAPEGLRLTALARSARITKQSMGALVEHLEEAGYVERVPDPDDARAVRISLTARGQKFGRAIRAFVRGVEAEWAERIGPRRFDELKAALELLRSSLLADE